MPKTASEKMKIYRARLRKAGLRPVQLWLADITAPNFAENARRQSSLVSGTVSENETLDFMEAIEADDLKQSDGV